MQLLQEAFMNACLVLIPIVLLAETKFLISISAPNVKTILFYNLMGLANQLVMKDTMQILLTPQIIEENAILAKQIAIPALTTMTALNANLPLNSKVMYASMNAMKATPLTPMGFADHVPPSTALLVKATA